MRQRVGTIVGVRFHILPSSHGREMTLFREHETIGPEQSVQLLSIPPHSARYDLPGNVATRFVGLLVKRRKSTQAWYGTVA